MNASIPCIYFITSNLYIGRMSSFPTIFSYPIIMIYNGRTTDDTFHTLQLIFQEGLNLID